MCNGSPKKDEKSSQIFDSQSLSDFPRISGITLPNPLLDLPETEINIKDYELSDILDIPALQSLMDDFSKLTGMVTALLDTKGTVLVATGWHDICTQFHRCNPQTAQYCTESDLYLAQNIKQGEFVAYKCKNNLWDVVTPLYIMGKHLGNIYTGQFFFDDEQIDDAIFIQQARQYGFNQKDYLEALHKVPRYSHQTVNQLMSYLVKMTEFISRLGLSSLNYAVALNKNLISERRYRNLFENSPVSIWEEDFSKVKEFLDSLKETLSEDFETWLDKHPEIVEKCSVMVNIVGINKATLSLLKASCKEDVLSNLQKTFTPHSYQAFKEEIIAIWKNQTELVLDGVIKTLTNQNCFITAYWSVMPGHEKDYSRVLVSLVDITERQESQEILNQQLAFFQNLIDTIPNPVFYKDRNGFYRGGNKAFEKYIDIGLKDLSGKTSYDLFPQELADFYHQKDKELFNNPGIQIYEFLIQTKDQGPRNVIFYKGTYKKNTGEIDGLIGVIVDITEQKRFEEALKESEEQFRTLMEQSPLSIHIMTPEGITVEVNKAYEDLWGLKQEDIKDYRLLEDKQIEALGIMPIMKEGFAGKAASFPPVYYKCLDSVGKGNARWIQGKIYPIKNKINKIINVVLVYEDITQKVQAGEEKKKLEAQLIQSQKLEAVGLLAGGIAHDFNNMLTVIMGYGNILLSEISKESHLKPYINEILNSAEISANLTRQLLAFSRKQILSPRLTDINGLINEIKKLIKRIIGEDIEFITLLTNHPLPVIVDPGQIEQVLLNLCANSRDAMPQGGKLFIQTEYIYMDDFSAKTHELEIPGQYVLLSISDTGHGMNQETLSKIFEPFFTTKEMGKGTGLGLAIVYGIIKQHKGNITAYSEPGKGTTFKIYLPLQEKELPHQPLTAGTSSRDNYETILLAEDNEEVRKTMKMMLENAGFKVIEAKDGNEAVQLYSKYKDKIHLFLSDMIMPRMSGKEARDEIRNIKPNIKVLFTSGYTADLISTNGTLDKEIDFISKPVTPKVLITKVREILDRAT
jgi:PAS domain S-box-containing protein